MLTMILLGPVCVVLGIYVALWVLWALVKAGIRKMLGLTPSQPPPPYDPNNIR